MARCDHCGGDVALPFSCQYCGEKLCPACRLPPNHNCVNIGLWNSKPRPAVGISYSRGGGASPTGGGYTPAGAGKKTGTGPAGTVPFLKIMIAVILITLLAILYLLIRGS